LTARNSSPGGIEGRVEQKIDHPLRLDEKITVAGFIAAGAAVTLISRITTVLPGSA
jgi:hypothetical protein